MSAAKKMALVGDAAVHWTKRPENAKKVKLMLRRRQLTRAATQRNKNSAVLPPSTPESQHAVPQDVFAYALGYLECWLESYAKSASVSPEALAARMGEVLSVKSRR